MTDRIDIKLANSVALVARAEHLLHQSDGMLSAMTDAAFAARCSEIDAIGRELSRRKATVLPTPTQEG